MATQNIIHTFTKKRLAHASQDAGRRRGSPKKALPKREFTQALELANALHSCLELDKLIELFSQETQHIIEHNGIEFRNDELNLQLRVGREAIHSCSYRLLVGGDNLGELLFLRAQKFSESEVVQIEYLLASLLAPLRNSLMYKQALETALRDPLTGVSNRASFDQSLVREVDLAHRHQNPLALIVMDIDHFKKINDQYGHLIGDCVLRDVAKCTQRCIRSSDMVFRYGGEEFVILLSNTTPEGANLLAERIRRSIEKQGYVYSDHSIRATVSMGIACLCANENPLDFFARADKALYESKQNGRNRTTAADG